MYQLYEAIYTNENNVSYVGYGIRETKSYITIKDITSDRLEIVKLIEKMNRLELSVIHMRDVIDDFVYSYPFDTVYKRKWKSFSHENHLHIPFAPKV